MSNSIRVVGSVKSLISLLAAGLMLSSVACGKVHPADQGKRSAGFPGCRQVPSVSGNPDWLPADVPLPAKARRVRDLPDQAGGKAALLAVPAPLNRFPELLEKASHERGWTVLGGDREQGEVDRVVRKGRDVVRLRVRSPYCSRSWTEVQVGYFRTGPSCPGTNKPCDYIFGGFLPPVSGDEINTVKAGDELVIRWRLKDPQGNPYSNLRAMVAGKLQEPTEGASLSLKIEKDLKFEDGTYRLSIFTVKGWAGTLKTLTLILDDGSVHQARFRFT